jgi:predicted TIM-barrel fold metal-dependent hydrolase
MGLPMKALIFSGIVLAGLAGWNSQAQEKVKPTTTAVSGGFSPAELRAFTALDPVDAHAHVWRSDPAFDRMLNRLNVHLLDIVVVNDQEPEQKDLRHESDATLNFIRGSGGHAAFCTSIDPYKMGEPGFTADAIRGLDRDFARGAVAVKIWKNIGMQIKDADGNYVLPDDPALEPIYKDIAAHNKTLIAHIADPDSAWAPLDPASPDYSYYKANTYWYEYGKPHPPSKAQILLARDHILEQNPNLRMVGAHLGSMESNFKMLAQHLDRYPNFAVDMAARIPYLARLPRTEAIAFIVKYQDRLIYGSDLGFRATSTLPQTMDHWEEYYARDWRFLATTETVDFAGHTAKGLALPDAVLRRLYHENAVHWFPGILSNAH